MTISVERRAFREMLQLASSCAQTTDARAKIESAFQTYLETASPEHKRVAVAMAQKAASAHPGRPFHTDYMQAMKDYGAHCLFSAEDAE